MTQAPATPELVERLKGLLVEEDRMHPIGCATWLEEALILIEEAADAVTEVQALADRYEKALDLALDVAIGQERRLIKYGKPANELAWLIEQIRQALSSQGRHEGGQHSSSRSQPCGVGPSDLTDPRSQHSDGGHDV